MRTHEQRGDVAAIAGGCTPGPVDHQWISEGVDIVVPTSSRIYDYALGGNYNFRVDREFWRELVQIYPAAQAAAHANRAFLVRAVTALLDTGIRQFLDLGAGFPVAGCSVHELVLQADPTAWTVYIDVDPVVVELAQHQLENTAYAWALHGDLRRPDTFLDDMAQLLDLNAPVAVLAGAVLHAVPDTDHPAASLARIAADLADGSYLVLTHAAPENTPDLRTRQHAALQLYQRTPTPLVLRTADQITALLGDSWEPLPPGVTRTDAWHPEPSEPVLPCPPSLLATIARRRPPP